MKRYTFILFTLITTLGYSQSRIVINNNGYIVIDNSAYIVLENGNANALATAGSGGNILSEDETDVIKWNLSAATGVHTIPWTNTSGTKIPLAIDVTGSGSAGGSLLLSTYGTNNGNTTWPAVAPAVNDMCSSIYADDASLKVIDRFWRIDANSYGTKPAVNLSFAYDYTNEGGGGNLINENNLQAQRYNPNTGDGNTACFSVPGTGVSNGTWEGLLFGTVNTGTKKVNAAVVTAANLYKDWILVDNTTPLPVELVSFEVNCKGEEIEIKWGTKTEINNDYFLVEKSYDALTFFELTRVMGAGNSSVTANYIAKDSDPFSGITYYRLKQVDFDGTVIYHEVAASNCNSNGFSVNRLQMNNEALEFNIAVLEKEGFIIYLYDSRGRMVVNKRQVLAKGNHPITLSRLQLSTGIYMLSIIGERNTYATKLMIGNE